MIDGLDLYLDRMSVEELENEHAGILEAMRQSEIGKTDDKDTVHFCGLASAGHGGSVMFLPRRSQTEGGIDQLSTASLTMNVLARYGHEKGRAGGAAEKDGNTGLLAVIKVLADDFRDNGIYVERVRYKSKSSGKPDWARTVASEMAFFSSDGNIVYPEIRTTKALDSYDSILARIQASIIMEISENHGWWLPGISKRSAEFKRYVAPQFKRVLWANRLRSLLPELFASRAIFLANSLISYLDNNKNRGAGNFIYGIEDFHWVWEHMLIRVLKDVGASRNSDLPKPSYISESRGTPRWIEGMKMDLVVEQGTHLTILDAKYYDAIDREPVPRIADIVKQFAYEAALKSVVQKGETVSSGFVFPSCEDGAARYTHVEMMHKKGQEASGFPKVLCHYVDLKKVMAAYIDGTKIEVVGIHQ